MKIVAVELCTRRDLECRRGRRARKKGKRTTHLNLCASPSPCMKSDFAFPLHQTLKQNMQVQFLHSPNSSWKGSSLMSFDTLHSVGIRISSSWFVIADDTIHWNCLPCQSNHRHLSLLGLVDLIGRRSNTNCIRPWFVDPLIIAIFGFLRRNLTNHCYSDNHSTQISIRSFTLLARSDDIVFFWQLPQPCEMSLAFLSSKISAFSQTTNSFVSSMKPLIINVVESPADRQEMRHYSLRKASTRTCAPSLTILS